MSPSRVATANAVIDDDSPVDRRALAARLRLAARIGRLKALGLIAPLFLFLVVTFILPIALLLVRAVDNREISAALPQTAAVLSDWNGEDMPSDEAYQALAADLAAAPGATTADIARRLNFYDPGIRSKIMKTARQVQDVAPEDARKALLEADKEWGKPGIWQTLKAASPAFTGYYILRALDLDRDQQGSLTVTSEPIYIEILIRTVAISLGVTALCLVLGYPLAYLLASVDGRTSRLLMMFVLLPFWTSLLVRTTAWLVLLQGSGVINSLLQWVGLISSPIELVHNRIGVFVAMTHILLPFVVLPVHAVMKGIPGVYMRAASSLGAAPWRGFLHVYLPLTLPGVGAGSLLVFILSLGYYITPMLVGGPRDQMLSSFIAYFVNQSTNWSMAAALATILLAVVALLYIALAIAFGGRRAQGA